QVCEYLPRMARWMHKVAQVRSVTHSARLHDSAAIHTLTGRPLEGEDRELFAPLPQEFPSYGSAVAYFQRRRNLEAPFASLPFTFHNVVDVPCQGGGFLGSIYDPLRMAVDAAERHYRADWVRRADDLDAGRIHGRRQLLDALEGRSPSGWGQGS